MPAMLRSALVLAAALGALPAARADPASTPAPETGIGSVFVFDPGRAGPYLGVGCLDHRTLMFVVSETEGNDPAIARLLAGRDCRPLVDGARYLRCGPGGYAYPAKGERVTYSAYCRMGASDGQLYVLDLMMPAPAP